MANANKEGKKDFKVKVGHLIQQYERNKQQELLQKQQLKQNIMIQIMHNRNKLSPITSTDQAKSHTSPTYNSNPPSEQCSEHEQIPQVTFNPRENKINLGHSIHPNASIAAQENSKDMAEPFRPQEITFSSHQQRKKGLQEEISYKPKIYSKEQAQVNEDEDEEFKKSVSRITKYANKYFPNQFQEPIEVAKSPFKQEQQPYDRLTYGNLSKVKTESYLDSNLSYNRSQVQQKEDRSQFERKEDRFQLEKQANLALLDRKGEAQLQAHQEESEEKELHEDNDNHPQEDQRGVFLTMQESQSMAASDVPKNVAFEIKMDRSVDPDHLEELRKQKIKEMQKKRQERIQQYRRTEASKKVQLPRGRSSHALKHQKIQKEDVDVDIPAKSVAIERKSHINRSTKIQNRSQREAINNNQLIPLENHESQYQIKHSRVNKKYELEAKVGNHTYLQPQQPNYPPVSPIRTPKTILSENRPKSIYKNSNIFAGESQYTRQKSASRIPEPKIEPKDRKYSFTRQSNKKLMVNAITYVCFPGDLNRKDRQRLIEVLQSSEHEFFVFLFKQYSRKIIKGIYILDSSQTKLEKIYGEKGPYEITADRVKQFYRFDSGSRQFKKVDGCRSFSYIIHAIDLS